MSWDDLRGRGVDGRLSEADTLRFGFPVARIVARVDETDSEGASDKVTDLLGRLRADVSIVRWPARLTRMGENLLSRGHALVPADTLVYWGLDLPAPASRVSSAVVTVRERPDLLAGLSQSVRRVFADYPSHYTASAAFHGEEVAHGYAEWAETLAVRHPEWSFLMHQEGRVTGLATAQILNDSMTLEVALAGIEPDCRGKGNYRVLLSSVLARAGRADQRRLIISTQASNTAVQSVWAGLGLRPFAAMTTVHVRRHWS